MTRRIRVGVLFGGRSGEHEVSLMSARSILSALRPEKYEVVPIGITKDGQWLVGGDPLAVLSGEETTEQEPPIQAVLRPDSGGGRLIPIDSGAELLAALGPIDVFFPVLHGTYGEDGCVQGLFELADVPYVGSGVAASAVGMDKVLMKAVFRAADLPLLGYHVVKRRDLKADPENVAAEAAQTIGFPCFVKPACLGSSVGISKAKNLEELIEGLKVAARYDRKILVEEAAIDCQEIEVSVLGNDDPVPSIPGEIVPSNEFYDYKAKYIDDRSELHIPARIAAPTTVKVMELAVRAFKAIDAAGLARVDFFVKRDGSAIYINEVNTMPGFTRISMYPKLWEASGLSFSQLIDRLIELAFERYEDEAESQRIYQGE